MHSDYGKSKKAAAWREDLDEMSSGEEENMMDGDDVILDGFLPSEGEGDGEKGTSVGCLRIWQHWFRGR